MSDAVTRALGRPRTPIEHGTEAGYQKHRRYGPPIDVADSCGCRRANREATYIRMQKHTPKPRRRVRPKPSQRLSATERRAAAAVRRYAHDAADAADLLAALGLVAA